MAVSYNGVAVPSDGQKIGYAGGKYQVPDRPIIPFIEGDGTGRDIWKASLRVFNAAVEKAYKGKRGVAWYEIFAGEKAKAKLRQFKGWCFGQLPVCIAKTQYSFSDNPKLLGAPSGWTLNVTDASVSAGAGFIVVISGSMMLMPGLPKVSRALSIDVDANGEIIGV